MYAYLRKNTALFLIFAVLGGTLGAGIVSFCQDGSCAASSMPGALPVFDAATNHAMLAQSVYFVWLIFIAFIAAFSFLLALPLWSSLQQFRAYLTRRRVGDLIVSAFLLLLLFAVPDGIFGLLAGAGKPLPIYLFFPRILILLLIVYLSLLPSMIGIWLIRDAVEKQYDVLMANEADFQSKVADFLSNHIRLRELSQLYLAAIGIVVTLVTLTNGANRNVMTALQPNGNSIPTSVVLVYGFYFTVVVILIYAPTYFSLLHTGFALRDRLYPVQQVEALGETVSRRKVFEESLQLNINVEQSLRTGLIVLSPLLTGLVSLLLGKS